MEFYSTPKSSAARSYNSKSVAGAIYLGTNFATSTERSIRCVHTCRPHNSFGSCPTADFCDCVDPPSKKPDILVVSLFTAMVRLNYPMARDVSVDTR